MIQHLWLSIEVVMYIKRIPLSDGLSPFLYHRGFLRIFLMLYRNLFLVIAYSVCFPNSM